MIEVQQTLNSNVVPLRYHVYWDYRIRPNRSAMKLQACDSCNTTNKVEWCESCKRFMCAICDNEIHSVSLP